MKTVFLLFLLSQVVLLYGQNEIQSNKAEMYTTLVSKDHKFQNCSSDTIAYTFIFKVISSTDTHYSPGNKIAIAIICPQKFENDLEIGNSYNLTLSSLPKYNGSLVLDLLVDGGDRIIEFNQSEIIYWLTDFNEMNPDFIRMAEVKLGIADFPMKKLNTEKPIKSMYSVTSDDFKSKTNFGLLFDVSNYSFPLNNESYLKKGEIGVFVDTTLLDYYDDEFEGYRMYVYNNSSDTAFFPSIDSRIRIIAQAQAQNGIWYDIERLGYSDCGLSYYDVILTNGRKWTLVAPLTNGQIKTKLRISLSYSIDGRNKTIYSNVYNGSINLGQLIQNN